ncbi:MAG TPA: PQQ-dependent sugar dehydrogenase [Gemmatimonadaceae bacterium]|nr:PQQ-dependent sugar dehydrogenase [Gemmatimonadaceae bacterium]
MSILECAATCATQAPAAWRAAVLAAVLATVGCKSNRDAAGAGTTTGSNQPAAAAAAAACPRDNGGITLPAGFCATVFADDIGHARHVAVAPNGDVYVNTWSGGYYASSPDKGGFIVAMRDTNRDGKADIIARFGSTKARGGHGGTGIGLHGGAVYAEEGATIVRYTLPSSGLAATGAAETVVRGMPLGGDHPMHPFAIDSSGALFVDMGSATNSCQEKNRTLQSPGHKPCTELDTRGGIWRFDANKTGQAFTASARYATGIRNAVGITIGPDGDLYSTQHGRDQLAENWPKLYSAEQGQNLPAEELLHVQQGADYGWPECYFDGSQQKLVLAPEYGGDGKTAGECASKQGPIASFPAHWAPDGLTFYTGAMFPEHFRGGAFIAFHGSWNRAPGPQGGYNVVFVPFTNGKPSGASTYEVFANGFAGGKLQPDAAAHRPAGVAQGPDGALYITDDKAGRVWRVVYRGGQQP